MIERLRNESGYSMVEVMVAIVILMVAIIPMFTMFDVGLRTATTSSNYDKARSLAQKHVEFAQSMEYGNAIRDDGEGFPRKQAMSCDENLVCRDTDPVYEGFRYEVTKTFVRPVGSPDSGVSLEGAGAADEGLLRIDIKVVKADGGAEVFETSGVIAR